MYTKDVKTKMTLREITKDALSEILKKHLSWINDEPGGEKADLSYANLRHADLSYADLRSADLSYADLRSADLSYADLSYANLRSANLRYANLRSANLRSADLSYADLSYADLSYANLRYADLSYADLRSANLDYSAFPLWCGSFGVKVDIRLGAQLAYHFCRLDTENEDVKKAQKALKILANKFHRVKECGEIE